MCTGIQQYKTALLLERITKAARTAFGFTPRHDKDYVAAWDIVKNDEVTSAIWQRQLQNILCLIGRRVYVSEQMLAAWLVDGVFKGMVGSEAMQTMQLMTGLFEHYGIHQTACGRVKSTQP